MFNLLTNRKSKVLRQHEKHLNQIKKLSITMQDWDDNTLKAQTEKFKQELNSNSDLNKILPEAFATVVEACRRVFRIKLFDVQILGGIILHEGNITEMKTGEGKTLTATLPAYLNALTGKKVHVVTVNDYLAKRDAEWMGQIFQFLNIEIGLIQQNMGADMRKLNYSKDIVYVTNSELGFDYLRDNMAIDVNEIVQTGFDFCIIDEVDSILIDEARTPLIISGPSDVPTNKYITSNKLVQQLIVQEHYEIDEKAKNTILTDQGIVFCETFLRISNIYQIEEPWAQYILNALKAHNIFIKDRNYIVKDNQVVIVDEFTGRIMPGRRWSDGLHQAIEAKEGVAIQKENQTLASITYQNFFLLYSKLSGMTGTALTESQEFEKIYKTNVITVPTNKDCIRMDLPDLVYKQEYNKWTAIANECYDMYQVGRPTLIGTTNVEKSELLAKLLDEYKLPYNLLNAKPENVERESQIIAQAGQSKTLTIATNMAGRGTDIILGGNPEQFSKLIVIQTIKDCFIKKQKPMIDYYKPGDQIKIYLKEMIQSLQKDNSLKDMTADEIISYIESSIVDNKSQKTSEKIYFAYKQILDIYRKDFLNDKEQVIKLGGLHVIGTERHESRRIDNQLRGRSGRQGDPGSSRFFLSLEDNLLRIFGGDKILQLMETLNIDDDVPIESAILNRSLNNAQKKVESYYYDIRKQLFEYDEVLNNQRQAIYAERNRILYSTYVRDCLLEYGESTIDEIISFYSKKQINETKDSIQEQKIYQKIQTILNLPTEIDFNLLQQMNEGEIKCFLHEQFHITYDLREAYLEQLRPGLIRQLEKYYLLQQIDTAWQEHLEKMANLRESIGWRSYGQQDPLTEYKNEAFSLFIEMITYIRETVSYFIMRSRLVIDSEKAITGS
uniref:Protein translocase subunit SecA n=1 Tax=Helminthora furcellata TaxID=1884666 RepID=A0A1G4NRC1_9FLOR|nr:Preprotein-translocase subunit a [Helminthora furcellata]SCW21089.1 Preprotein-translocase subunit a [Helminthora furcellata]SCW23949.1 Preprotein-translocase subunit a [Helminthora furcellata]